MREGRKAGKGWTRTGEGGRVRGRLTFYVCWLASSPHPTAPTRSGGGDSHWCSLPGSSARPGTPQNLSEGIKQHEHHLRTTHPSPPPMHLTFHSPAVSIPVQTFHCRPGTQKHFRMTPLPKLHPSKHLSNASVCSNNTQLNLAQTSTRF